MGQLLTHTNKKGYPKKYNNLRDEIQSGDLILYRGTSFLAKCIQFFDKAYYNHIGIAWRPEDSNRVLTLDMWSDGLDCVPLSRRMDSYSDFCILRPKVSSDRIKEAIHVILEDWDGRDIKYDNMLLLRVAMIKSTRMDITGLGKKDKYICSEFTQKYCHYLGLKTYSNLNIITPEDFRRFIDDNFELISDDSSAPDMSFYQRDCLIKHLFGNNYKIKD